MVTLQLTDRHVPHLATGVVPTAEITKTGRGFVVTLKLDTPKKRSWSTEFDPISINSVKPKTTEDFGELVFSVGCFGFVRMASASMVLATFGLRYPIEDHQQDIARASSTRNIDLLPLLVGGVLPEPEPIRSLPGGLPKLTFPRRRSKNEEIESDGDGFEDVA